MTAQEFWNWFEKNNAQYLFLNVVDGQEKERLMDELLDVLHEYCSELFFEIGGFPEDRQELIVTAQGDIDYFDNVEELINQAPKIKNWTFIAFKPAMGFEFKLKYKEITFDPGKMWFIPLESEGNPKHLGIRIGFSDFDESQKGDFLHGTFLLLDNALGEKRAVSDIHYLEVVPLPADPEDEGFMELTELSAYMDWWKITKQVE